MKHFDVVAFGEALIDLVATAPTDSLFDAAALVPRAGGAPANVAVGVARLGKRSAFIGKVGADDFGVGLRHLLRTEGVETRGVVTDPSAHTTMALVGVSAAGEPRFTFASGAHAALMPQEVDQTVLAAGRILACGSVMLAHPQARATLLATLARARAAGMCIAYDVNWRPALWGDVTAGLATIREPLTQIDLLKMNAAELRLVTGTTDLMQGLAQVATSASLVVVTRGAEGCCYRLGTTLGSVAGVTLGPVIDTIGAGDAFLAALLAELPDDLATLSVPQLEGLLARACRAGAISVTRRGAIASLPVAADM
ncbi:MAG: carbohydrate kinase [Ktedonobacterales bacterium]|nr:carbohydrate kinase [Ktedonobacterales bacterium]